MPLQATSGAASYDAFGGGVAAVPQYIEDVFSTWLYTGTGAAQTITNGIDLSTKGGMVWIKGRSTAYSNLVQDTNRGAYNTILTDGTGASANYGGAFLSSFNSNGFSIGSGGSVSLSGTTFASWTFRKQPKFFDVVTYTGNGSARTIAHSLGSTPGCMFVKRTDSAGDWHVYHSGYGGTGYYVLNSTAGASSDSTIWNDTNPTSTVFSVGTGNTNVNGGTYVAYLFASNAGGFGLTGTDNVISCGTFSTNASGVRVQSLGYEPQWILIKRASGGTGDWYMFDTMRGWSMSNDNLLYANLSDSESSSLSYGNPTATGFETANLNGSTTFIYIAIRKGPMKVPTSGTSVYNAVARTGTSTVATISGIGFAPDVILTGSRSASGSTFIDKLRGKPLLITHVTNSEETYNNEITSFNQNGFTLGDNTGGNYTNISGYNFVYYNFKRAPSFFDVVCYTGTGAAVDVNHNLKVKPELMLIKKRSLPGNWMFHHYKDNTAYRLLRLNETTASLGDFTGSDTNSTSFRAYLYTPDTGVANDNLSVSGATYVAYLFATCAGVSKVGSYTGNGSSQTINCGFTGGARFVLIKRTNAAGDWYVWDSTRGIVAGNDPHLSLNTNAAEVTTDDTIDTDSTGFVVNQVAATNVNVNAATYIFLAIA